MDNSNNLQQSQVAQLARIDERTSILVDLVTALQASIDTKFAQQKNDFEKTIADVRKEFDKKIEDLELELDKKISKHEFGPVRMITYGQVGVVLLAVFGAIIKLVVLGP
jgi:hypothetical protein